MNKFQWEKHRKLVQELKQRREGIEKNLIIFNGEIIATCKSNQCKYNTPFAGNLEYTGYTYNT